MTANGGGKTAESMRTHWR